MGDGGDAFEEGLIAGIFVDVANKTAVDFQVIEFQVMDQVNFLELPAKVFEAELAAARFDILIKGAGITERTVKAHVGAILEKFKLKNRLQLALFVKDS